MEDVNRRTYLCVLAGVGAAGLAGCTSSGEPNGAGDTPTDEDTPTETDESPTTTEGEVPTVTDTAFEVTDRTNGTERDEASVTFDGDRVVVDGTIWGRNGCKTAELVEAAYDAESDELAVVVGTTDSEGTDGQACTEAIVEIRYRAVVTFDGGLPEKVWVAHDHGDGPEDVTTATP